MDNRTYSDRYKVNYSPSVMAGFTNEEGPWSENEQDIVAGLAWGREKDRLLKWVRLQMRRHLTRKQRRALQLYYFKNLTFGEIALEVGCSPSAACRSVQRGVERLRDVAREEGVGYSPRWQRVGESMPSTTRGHKLNRLRMG